ncbi:MAG: acyl-CoA thioesterase [Candidatus Thorarchaeota archaeon]
MNQEIKRPSFTAAKQKEAQVDLVVTQGDITPYGSASFINYVRWYGIARDALLQWRDLGFEDSLKSYIEIEVSFCNIQYKRPAMLQDEIIIKSNCSDITDKNFTLLFTLIKKDDAALIGLGKQKINFRNSKTGDIFDLPESFIKNVLKPIEVDEKSMLFNF